MIERHPLMQFFVYAHLPRHLQAASVIFEEAARFLDEQEGDKLRGDDLRDELDKTIGRVEQLPNNEQRRVCISKLTSLRSLVSAYPNGEGGISKGTALQILLEAKDACVRAVIMKKHPVEGATPAPEPDEKANG